MGTPTYKPIASVTLSASTSSVTISNISQDFNDLYLNVSAGSNALDYLYCRINGSTVNYKWGDWHTNGWNAQTSMRIGMLDPDLRAPGVFVLPQYKMTDRYRQLWGRMGVTQNDSQSYDVISGGWESGDPITSLTFFTTGTFTAGSSFSIYGVIR